MRKLIHALLILPLTLSLGAMDVPSQARGWMKMDITGTLVALDPAAVTLTPWGKELGASPELKLKGLPQFPDFWVPSGRGGMWVVCGTQLLSFQANGKQADTLRLPAPVGDMCWDANGFVLSYRTPEPYLERRAFKDGKVVWATGTLPNGGGLAVNRHYVAMDSEDRVLVTTDGAPECLILDGAKGSLLGRTRFRKGDQDGPRLPIPQDQPTSLFWIPGQKAFARAADGAGLGLAPGVTIVRYDMELQTMSFHPTPLAAGHTLLGIFDEEAFFVRPEGGIAVIPFKQTP